MADFPYVEPGDPRVTSVPARVIWDVLNQVSDALTPDITGPLVEALSQPTPTAEPDRVVVTRNQIENGVRHVIEDGEWSDADDLPSLIVNEIVARSRYLPGAPAAPKFNPRVTLTQTIVPAPPSIADMTPGATFEHEGERWKVLHDGLVMCEHGGYRDISSFPTVIRDVTPPIQDGTPR